MSSDSQVNLKSHWMYFLSNHANLRPQIFLSITLLQRTGDTASREEMIEQFVCGIQLERTPHTNRQLRPNQIRSHLRITTKNTMDNRNLAHSKNCHPHFRCRHIQKVICILFILLQLILHPRHFYLAVTKPWSVLIW